MLLRWLSRWGEETGEGGRSTNHRPVTADVRPRIQKKSEIRNRKSKINWSLLTSAATSIAIRPRPRRGAIIYLTVTGGRFKVEVMSYQKLIAAVALGLISEMIFCGTLHAQIFSSNIVGYINQPLYAGDNLIADQLSYSNNTLNAVLNTSVPEGATFTEWDSTAGQFLPTATYDTNSGWSINYSMSFGDGGLLHTPTTFTNTFFGSVWPGFPDTGPYVPPLVTSYGLLLLSCYVPIGPATFYDVVGRAPQDGESVTILNALTQISTTTTFVNGAWNNGDPVLAVGQSAFFNLGTSPVPTPEPDALSLAAAGTAGAALLAMIRRRRGK